MIFHVWFYPNRLVSVCLFMITFAQIIFFIHRLVIVKEHINDSLSKDIFFVIVLLTVRSSDRNIFLWNSQSKYMVSLYSLTGRFWSRLRFDRRFQLKASVFLFFFLSLIFGQGDGLVFSFGWVSLGLMGFILLYRLQERFFFITVWMAIIYFLIFLGSIVAFNYAEQYDNWFIQIFGISILAIAFVACLYMILLMKERRDLLALEGEYVPIGFWFILVLLFYWSSVFAQVGFIRWADDSLGNLELYRTLYIAAEIILIPTFILVVTFPEDKFTFSNAEDTKRMGVFNNLIKNITFRDLQKRLEKVSSKEIMPPCPRCKIPLSREIKKCPSCDSSRYFYWCDTSQDYLVRCPSCFKLTMIGSDRCINCNARMSSKIRCSKCKDINKVDDWI